MKIVFTADEPKGLESAISYHFGHCPYFVVVDIEGDEIVRVQSIENPLAGEHAAGDLPSFMQSIGANVIVTGGMGPKAQQYFAEMGIQPVTGAYGKVGDVLKEVLGGRLKVAEQAPPPPPKPHEHHEGDERIERLEKEVVDLRRQIAEIKSLLLKLEEKLGGD